MLTQKYTDKSLQHLQQLKENYTDTKKTYLQNYIMHKIPNSTKCQS